MTTIVLDRPIAVPAPIAQPDDLEIIIAPRHIAQGTRRSGDGCAVAVALQEDGYDATVTRFAVQLYGSFGARRYACSPELHDWIKAFDRGDVVAPERFRLRRSGAA